MQQAKPNPQTQSGLKLQYFTCRQGPEHEGQVLNYVCIKKECPKRGLLCSMCKISHQQHPTMPLKILLSRLQAHRQTPLEYSQGFQNQLAQLQTIHKCMLYDLRVCVEALADKFRLMEQHINQEFSKAKIQLLERVQVNMKFNTFVDDAIANRLHDFQAFVADIAKISGMLELHESKNGKDKDLNIKFSANFGEVIQNLKSVHTKFSQSFQKITSFIQNLKIPSHEEVLTQKLKPTESNKQKQKQIKPVTPSIKQFSPQYRSTTIELQDNRRVARQSKTGDGRFVFTAVKVVELKQKIAFKIKVLKNWIGLGIGIRQRLKFLHYKFEYNNLGHGSYLASSNGYSWSHSQQSNNISVISFKFKQGDIIQLEYQKTKLNFLNRSNNEKFQLKLGFNQVEEKDIYFCANLCSEGDSIEICEA